ncbi:uncharacterized protein G2W53_044220 [Senna tora]|uniref:Uncharacterized protein n=1 Tax=Senna tora TaxID=362788 RepID=A0A834SWZ7_9FABA|nr:uncharacterized protein G2W53_044220 [Senna tora]
MVFPEFIPIKIRRQRLIDGVEGVRISLETPNPHCRSFHHQNVTHTTAPSHHRRYPPSGSGAVIGLIMASESRLNAFTKIHYCLFFFYIYFFTGSSPGGGRLPENHGQLYPTAPPVNAL